MAAPITHIALASKIFGRCFRGKSKKKFFIGTSFPDIRYLGVIGRDQTHFESTDLTNLKKVTPFMAGMKFHSVVDQIREEFVVNQKLYFLFPEFQQVSQAVKLIEDQILYDNVGDWKSVIYYFDEILAAELSFGINRENVKKWHLSLQQYFSNRPGIKEIRAWLSYLAISDELEEGIIKLVAKYQYNNQIIKITNDLYDQFESLL